MNARWIGRILRGVRAGERHCALNHAALFVAPEVISLKTEWFLNGKEMPLRCAGIPSRREYFCLFKLEWCPSGNARIGNHHGGSGT
jgi:hypothetical protein